MIDRQIAHFPVPSNQVAALPVDVQRRESLFTFKWIQPPTTFRFACFWWFSIFYDHTVDLINLFGQFPGESEVGFFLLGSLFVRRGFLARAATALFPLWLLSFTAPVVLCSVIFFFFAGKLFLALRKWWRYCSCLASRRRASTPGARRSTALNLNWGRGTYAASSIATPSTITIIA